MDRNPGSVRRTSRPAAVTGLWRCTSGLRTGGDHAALICVSDRGIHHHQCHPLCACKLLAALYFFADGLTTLGLGLVLLGVGILMTMVSLFFTRWCLHGLTLLFGSIVKGGRYYEK